MTRNQVLLRRVRLLLILFILGLVLSGLTAFPLQWELELLARWMGAGEADSPGDHAGLAAWIVTVRNGLRDMYARYPWIAYGTDWLGFGIVILAVLFAGPVVDPVRNLWVIHFGLFACVAVIPLALICGPIRQIPFYWRLIDCSFGVVGFVLLWLARKYTLELARPPAPRRC